MSTYRSAVYEWLPPDVELMTDTSEADWVVSALRPWDEGGVRVGSFMPDVFEAYARVPHARDPVDGRPSGVLGALVSLFSGSLDRGDRCWFCLWDGWGTWWKGAHGLLTSHVGPRSRAERAEVRDAARRERRIDDERDRVLRGTPRVRTPHRDYFLVRGPLSAAVPLAEAAGDEVPNLWWPEDRSWLVSSEIDGEVTCVGGSTELIGSLLASRRLEAVETSVSARLG